ncbi:hypothetical protein BGX34_002160, partial [Mortierella sp. NVP85]
MNEIHKLRQGPNETTVDYMQRMRLTLKLLPKRPEPSRVSTVSERRLKAPRRTSSAGVEKRPPFQGEGSPAETLKETFETVMKFSKINQWGDVLSVESKLIKRSNAELPTQVEESVVIGATRVSGTQYSRFQKDLTKERIDDMAMDELADLFSAWTISAAGESDATARVARTIRRMNPRVARRVFGGTELAKHIISEPALVSTSTPPCAAFQIVHQPNARDWCKLNPYPSYESAHEGTVDRDQGDRNAWSTVGRPMTRAEEKRAIMIGVIEAKMDDERLGIAQNSMQLEAADIHRRKQDNHQCVLDRGKRNRRSSVDRGKHKSRRAVGGRNGAQENVEHAPYGMV